MSRSWHPSCAKTFVVDLNAHLQQTGIVSWPKLAVFEAAVAVELDFVADMITAVTRLPIHRGQARQWIKLPKELRDLYLSGSVVLSVQPLEQWDATQANAFVPTHGHVKFKATVRGLDHLTVAVPAAWFRGMQIAGWAITVRVRISTAKQNYVFVRDISVRGRTITLTLPKTVCAELKTGSEVTVNLTRPVVTPASTKALPDLANFPVADWQLWSEQQRQQELNQLVQVYRTHGFPWEALDAKRELNPLQRVQKSSITVTGDVISRVGYSGQGTCTSVHKHRLQARYRGQKSIAEAFDDDGKLRAALKFQLSCGDPITPNRLLNALSALNRGPMNFPSTLARWLVDQYCPENGVVYDPCSGYGGRLMGTLASYKQVKYIGADIEPATVDANRRLAVLVDDSDRTELHERAVEDDTDWPNADLVLTGPPYFDREDYGEKSTHVLRQYSGYEAWLAGFMTSLLRKSLTAAPCVIINVAVLKTRTAVLDLPGDVSQIAISLGATVERTLTWQLASFNRKGEEKIIVFRRAN